MTRATLPGIVVSAALVAAGLSSAQARPIFLELDGVKGETTPNASLELTTVGGQQAIDWQIPQFPIPGVPATVVFSPSQQNSGRPMESLSLNFTKVVFDAAAVGSSWTVADDVVVDGQIITAELWSRWVKLPGDGVRIEFGSSSATPGNTDIVLKRGGVPVSIHQCAGANDLAACFFLVTTCPDLECSVLCPALCGVPAIGRSDGAGGVALDLPLAGPTTFAMTGQPAVTADEISMVVRPARGASPMSLAGMRVSVDGLSGLRFTEVRADFGCPADINDSGALSVQDIFDFLAKYFAGSPEADFNASGGLSVQDLFEFLAAYFRGC